MDTNLSKNLKKFTFKLYRRVFMYIVLSASRKRVAFFSSFSVFRFVSRRALRKGGRGGQLYY